MRSIILSNIYEERCGQVIDRSMLRSILAMLVDLNVDGVNVYEEDFEQHFIESTRNFYRDESQNFLQQNACIEFLEKAQLRLNEEASRVSNYLSSFSGTKDGSSMVRHNDFSDILPWLIHSGCHCLVCLF